MIKLSEEAKRAYAKYVGPDGRLIIDPSLPDKVKEAFEYFNNEGINILELNIDDEIETEFEDDESFDEDENFDEEEEEEDELDDEDFEEDDEFEEDTESADVELNTEITEAEQANLNDLNNLF